MNINELDLITIKVDIYLGLLQISLCFLLNFHSFITSISILIVVLPFLVEAFRIL